MWALWTWFCLLELWFLHLGNGGNNTLVGLFSYTHLLHMHVCVCVNYVNACVVCVWCRCALRTEESESPRTGTILAVLHPTWMLGARLGSSARAVYTLNHWAISPIPETLQDTGNSCHCEGCGPCYFYVYITLGLAVTAHSHILPEKSALGFSLHTEWQHKGKAWNFLTPFLPKQQKTLFPDKRSNHWHEIRLKMSLIEVIT